MNTFCMRHGYSGGGECPYCTAVICQNCKSAPSTENWGGTHDAMSLARNHNLTQRWCHRCVIVAQIAYMRALVPKLTKLEAELAALDQIGSATQPQQEQADTTRRSAAKESSSHSADRVHWELNPVTAERLQQEFAARIGKDLNEYASRLAKRCLRDILSELTPRPKEGK